jgi:hypothetical protein
MTKKKDRAAELLQVSEALVEAFREELLGSNETRIAERAVSASRALLGLFNREALGEHLESAPRKGRAARGRDVERDQIPALARMEQCVQIRWEGRSEGSSLSCIDVKPSGCSIVVGLTRRQQYPDDRLDSHAVLLRNVG